MSRQRSRNAQRVLGALALGQLTSTQIAAMLGLRVSNVLHVLDELAAARRVTPCGHAPTTTKKWARTWRVLNCQQEPEQCQP